MTNSQADTLLSSTVVIDSVQHVDNGSFAAGEEGLLVGSLEEVERGLHQHQTVSESPCALFIVF